MGANSVAFRHLFRDPDRMIRITTASRFSRLPARTIRHKAHKGQIAALRKGRRTWLVRAGDVCRLIVERARRLGSAPSGTTGF